MIDFKKTNRFTIKPIADTEYSDIILPILIGDETILSTYSCNSNEGIVFTTKRIIIIISYQGVSLEKRGFTSLPYSKIQVFSQAFGAGRTNIYDQGCELEFIFSGIGKVNFIFTSNANILEIGKVISSYTL